MSTPALMLAVVCLLMCTIAIPCSACAVRIEVNDQGDQATTLAGVFDVLAEMKYSENKALPPFMQARGRAFVSTENPLYGIHVPLKQMRPLILTFGSGRNTSCPKMGVDLVNALGKQLAVKLGSANVKVGAIELERP